MKHGGSAFFPLAVLLALAGLTFWLRYAIQLPDERSDGRWRHDPDYIVDQPQLRKLDKSGNLQYTVNASEIRHYPDDNTTDMARPKMVAVHPGKPSVTMRAERAHLSQDGQLLELYENVRIRREATPEQAALEATMPDLTVRLDDENAFTRSPVVITQGESWLKGVGMQVDNKTQIYVLESQAVGRFESQHAERQSAKKR
ncbi:MAG: LPS export ABC transporter periplasmic protein LptC [Betaproteobacteria bacterium]|nr:LPS export ABC transporter periplasmic protein LptC [Betaproteobacteria bacterium]